MAKTLSVNDSDVRDFFAGFTQAKASFDFIEIGHTKPNTKIQETVKFNLRNYNCSQVLLGVSHDPSYSTFLRELDLDRVALLEGRAVAKELINTGVATATHFDAVFRSERPLDRKGSAPSSSAATSSIASTPVSVASVPFSCKYRLPRKRTEITNSTDQMLLSHERPVRRRNWSCPSPRERISRLLRFG